MVAIVVLHHKHVKRVKPFKPHVVSVATVTFFHYIWVFSV